jgi:hypothetical protein
MLAEFATWMRSHTTAPFRCKIAQFRLDLLLLLGRITTLLPGKMPVIVLLFGLRVGFGFLELVVISAIMQLGLALPMAYYFWHS